MTESVIIELGTKLVWYSGRGTTANKVVEVIKVHKDNSFRVSGLKSPNNRFTGYKMEYGPDAGKIKDTWFHSYGRTPGTCKAWNGQTQEQFDAKYAEVKAEKDAERDERHRKVDERHAEALEANADRIEQTKAPLDFDDMFTVELVNEKRQARRVIYTLAPKEITLWEKPYGAVQGVELRAAVYGPSSWACEGNSWGREEVEGKTLQEALEGLVLKLW